MNPGGSHPGQSKDERLPRMFAGIVIVEVLAILALFWAGRYFGS
jgi:hypothetical protein